MSYHIYQTKGIILGKKDVGEADRIFSILTEDFGRIDAMAQGSRYLKSKLRYNLSIFSYSRFGLVITKESWRIVDAEELNGWLGTRADPEKLAAASRIAELINRMVRGQESDIALWEEIKGAFIFLENADFKGAEELKTFELLIKIRFLSHLGYVEDHKKWLNTPFKKALEMETIMSFTIEKALEASQL